MNVYSASDIGLKRSSNQDYCLTGQFPDGSVWAIVCDGMGGANGGSTASRVAAENISESLCSGYREDMTPEELRNLMMLSVEYANRAVYDISLHVPGLEGMGTTVVLAVVRKGRAHIVHAGDSRAYICSEEGVRQITTDHSIVQQLVEIGEITPEQARQHPHRNMITRALGTEPNLRTDYNTVEFEDGARLIMCTDGMSNYLTDDELLEFIRSNKCEELTQKLIEHSKQRGGSDNITVAVISD